jgi:hypothetical protein
MMDSSVNLYRKRSLMRYLSGIPVKGSSMEDTSGNPIQ